MGYLQVSLVIVLRECARALFTGCLHRLKWAFAISLHLLNTSSSVLPLASLPGRNLYYSFSENLEPLQCLSQRQF